MSFEVGSILLIKDYQLPTKVKDKFFIVIAYSGNEVVLMSMTTSQIYFDESLINHGTIVDRELSVYCFEKDRVIGKENNFSFHKHTFLSHRSNIHEFNSTKLTSLDVEYKDCLTNKELVNLVYSFYTSKFVPKKFKGVLEGVLMKYAE